MSGWSAVEQAGAPARIHALELPEPASRELWICAVDRPTLVLGSTQREEVVDRQRAADRGVEVVRRRSGGGAVLLDPDDGPIWIDVVLPRGDPLWVDDVGRSSRWLGEVWARAIDALGIPASVQVGERACTRWSSLVCFGGTAPGEVTVAGRKVVGISQRRSRTAARLQSLASERWDPVSLLDLLVLDPTERLRASADLAAAAQGLHHPPAAVIEAFVAAIAAQAT